MMGGARWRNTHHPWSGKRDCKAGADFVSYAYHDAVVRRAVSEVVDQVVDLFDLFVGQDLVEGQDESRGVDVLFEFAQFQLGRFRECSPEHFDAGKLHVALFSITVRLPY